MSVSSTARRATVQDIECLASRGIRTKAESAVFVAETNGELLVVLSVAPRPFESQALRRPTAHIDAISNWCDPMFAKLIGQSLLLLSKEGCRLLTVRRPESERSLIASLQSAGFRVIECLITLSRALSSEKQEFPSSVTIADKQDADDCASIAKEIFTMDRFHADPHIEDALADDLKGQWARNCVLGRADKVFVTRENGFVTGFNACLLNGDTAVIDLIGVSRQHQGRGLGSALTAAAIAHYSGNARRMTVGTQSCNTASLALYQDAGFRIETSALTLHAHLS